MHRNSDTILPTPWVPKINSDFHETYRSIANFGAHFGAGVNRIVLHHSRSATFVVRTSARVYDRLSTAGFPDWHPDKPDCLPLLLYCVPLHLFQHDQQLHRHQHLSKGLLLHGQAKAIQKSSSPQATQYPCVHQELCLPALQHSYFQINMCLDVHLHSTWLLEDLHRLLSLDVAYTWH